MFCEPCIVWAACPMSETMDFGRRPMFATCLRAAAWRRAHHQAKLKPRWLRAAI